MAEIMEFDPKFSNQAKSFILGILEDEFNLRGIERPDLDDIKSAYQTGKGNFWVAIENGRVIGTIALLDCGDNRGYLKRMYVSREYRGMGLAKDLLDALARFARAAVSRKSIAEQPRQWQQRTNSIVKSARVPCSSSMGELPTDFTSIFRMSSIPRACTRFRAARCQTMFGRFRRFVGETRGLLFEKSDSKHGFRKIGKLPDDLPGFGDTIFYRLDLQNTKQ